MIKTILLCLIVSSGVIGIKLDSMQNADSQFQKVQQGSQMGHFFMDLAQLHSDVHGPLDDLKDTITKFYENLQGTLDKLDGDYSQKTAIHQKTLSNIELNVQNAQIDIAQSQDLLDNFLSSNQDITNRKLGQIKQNIADNRKSLSREKLERDTQHDQNIDRIHEHALAITGIDEALQLVVGLSNGSVAFSEAPLKKTVEFIKSRLDSRDEYAPMIQALINLSGTQDTKAIRDLLNKLRKSLVESQIQISADENQQSKMVEDRLTQLESEYSEFQTQVNQATYDLTSISARMDQEKQFTKARQNDLVMYQEQLELENSSYADITGLYNEFRSQKLKELKLIEDAKNFAYSAQFRDLLQSKANK